MSASAQERHQAALQRSLDAQRQRGKKAQSKVSTEVSGLDEDEDSENDSSQQADSKHDHGSQHTGAEYRDRFDSAPAGLTGADRRIARPAPGRLDGDHKMPNRLTGDGVPEDDESAARYPPRVSAAGSAIPAPAGASTEANEWEHVTASSQKRRMIERQKQREALQQGSAAQQEKAASYASDQVTPHWDPCFDTCITHFSWSLRHSFCCHYTSPSPQSPA